MTTEQLHRPSPSPDHALIDIVPAPIWIEDWTAIETFCAEQRALGVTDMRTVLETDEVLLRRLISMVNVTDVNEMTAQFVGAESTDRLLGMIPGDLLNQGSLRSLIVQIMVVWNHEYSTSVDVNGVDMGGADLECQLDWAAPQVGDQPDYSRVVVLLRDLSSQRTEEHLMRKNVGQLETLLDMSRGVASTFDTDLILDLLAETTIELTAAAAVRILLFDMDEEVLYKQIVRGEGSAGMAPDFAAIKNGISGWSARHRKATTAPDLGRDPRMAGLSQEALATLKGLPVVVAPIIDDGDVIGSVTVYGQLEAAPFTEAAQSIVQMIATQAAAAIRNADLYQELVISRDSVRAAHEELKHAQTQLLSAQKMEAIGGLAAGIAHEINTPIQFVSDNVSFIQESVTALARLGKAHIELLDQFTDHPELGDQIQTIRQQWKDDDCDFLLAELPDAIEETQEGARRVAEIVRAMKEFAHPGQEDLTPSDINRVIETTVQVSRNEWRYVAEIELDLDDTLPMVPALPGPLGQSLLIMIVNSAQAMAEARSGDGMGNIKISSRRLGDIVEIRVSDDGPGIPGDIIDRIFEPFFTTKDVGKGSGQGLSIAHSVIVDKHKGEIWADNLHPGAVFVIHLPATDKKSE